MMYELYMDVIFLVNLLPEYLVLTMTVHILNYCVGRGRIFLGSIFTSIVTCILLVLPGVPYVVRLLLAQFIGKAMVLWLILRIRKLHYFVKAMLLSCGCTFLVGGFLEWICRTPFFVGQRPFNAPVFLVLSGMSYLLFSFLRRVWNRLSRKGDCVLHVRIRYRGHTIALRGFVDTGNMLSEPIGGKPVCILDKKNAKALGYRELPENYRAIPYYAIGNPGGLLHGFMADEMVIEADTGTIKIQCPMLGVCDKEVSRNGIYEIILNAKLLKQERRDYVI